MLKFAALQLEEKKEPHFIEHLAPLCFFLKVPLYVKREEDQKLYQKLYPGVEFRVCHDFQSLSEDVFIYAHFHRMELEKVSKGKRFIYLPHGNSEKGKKSLWMEQYALEDITLLYGKRMEDFLKERQVFDLLNCMYIGNLRKQYYEKYKEHYQEVVKDLLPKKRKKTLLYAPTWNDWEGDSSLNEIASILKSSTQAWDIWIKLHPRVYADHLSFVFKLESTLPENAFLLEDTPLIYPILNQVDAYLGDVSSVAYDFLSQDKPLYFLQRSEPLYIHQAGRVIEKKEYENVLDLIERNEEEDLTFYAKERQNLYKETFANVCPNQVCNKLRDLVTQTKKKPLQQSLIELKGRIEELV